MGKVMTTGAALIERCVGAGWSIHREDATSVLVTPVRPDARPIKLPKRPSNGSALRNALAACERAGLLDDEQAAVTLAERERVARITADRERVELLPTAPPQGDLTPPGATSPDDADAAKERPEMQIRKVMVTPEWASDRLNRPMPILANGNPLKQRVLKTEKVAEWVEVIKAGGWKVTHQGVALSPCGAVLDGQHRLWAIIDSGRAQEMMVAYNVDPELYAVMDIGAPRTAGDIFHSAGEINATARAAAANLLAAYLRWEQDPETYGTWTRWDRKVKVPVTERLEIIDANPGLRDSVRIAAAAGRIGLSPAAAAVWHHLSVREWPTKLAREAREEFWSGLIHGEMVKRGDPPWTLREWALARKGKPMAAKRPRHLIVIINTWNKFCKQQELTMIKSDDGLVVPTCYAPRGARRKS